MEKSCPENPPIEMHPLLSDDEIIPATNSNKCGCVMDTFKQIFSVPYNPHPEDNSFLTRAQSQSKDDVDVKVAVLTSRESKRVFGRPLARRSIQPVWIEVTNRSRGPLFFDFVHLDPNYYPPLEAAQICHFRYLNFFAQVVSVIVRSLLHVNTYLKDYTPFFFLRGYLHLYCFHSSSFSPSSSLRLALLIG